MTTKKTATSSVPTPAKKISAKTVSSSPAEPVKVEPAVSAAKKSKKENKVKVMRDSFTMPEGEYRKIAEIKEAALQAGLPVKKSEVLRAGLKALAAMTPAQLKRALAGLEKIKTGRPKKH